MSDREIMQQALEALKSVLPELESVGPLDKFERALAAIITLRERLAQPEQEPVANNPDPYHLSRILHELAGSASMCWEHVDRAGVFQSTQATEVVAAAIAEIRQRMKDAPPQRKPLTDDEIGKIAGETLDPWSCARVIEAAHGIKENT